LTRELRERKALDVNDNGLRYPSWLDVIILAAVAAAVVAFYNFGWIRALPRTRVFAPDENAIIDALHEVRHVLSSAMPVGFALAVVGFARVLREPKPARRLLFRQPGVAACAAMVAALIVAAANTTLWLIRWIEFGDEWLPTGFPANILLEIAASHVGYCVIAVWAFLGLGGLCASGLNWVNWLGSALGILAVLLALLWCLP
jgi:hypothetical protein